MDSFKISIFCLFFLFTLSQSRVDECSNCLEERGKSSFVSETRWNMPFIQLGYKRYYVGNFFKANWYKANQYCRFHGMHLASIESKEENSLLEKHIADIGLGAEHFWTSGNDLSEEGSFVWFGNGHPISFTNWNTGEPNNFRYEKG